MIVLPLQINQKQYSLFVILEKENVDRIRFHHDPAEIVMEKLPSPWTAELSLKDIVICYVSETDLPRFMDLSKTNPIAALRFLSRGFAFRPDRGDDDESYESLR
jgi:hypothetical protein